MVAEKILCEGQGGGNGWIALDYNEAHFWLLEIPI